MDPDGCSQRVAAPDLHPVHFVQARFDIGWSVDFPDTKDSSASVLTTIAKFSLSLSFACLRFALVAVGPVATGQGGVAFVTS